MKQLKSKHFSLLSAFLLLFICCKAQEETPKTSDKTSDFSENYEVSKHFDKESNTYYYLTRIKHTDKNGKLIKLRLALANKTEGETVRSFAIRMNTALAFNASMGLTDLPPNVRQPKGIQIINGEIKQELKPGRYYTLGIKENNELKAYPPETKAADIIKDGSPTALTGFIPLIENHKMVSEELFKIAGHRAKHPRQVIAQFDNKDILMLSCGGRGFDGEGMTAYDLTRILKALDVRFAFNLDGGGSVSTVIGDSLITKKIDSNGTKERLRPNFLYVMANQDDK